jgi:hypothetical protein
VKKTLLRVYPNAEGHLCLTDGSYGRDLRGEWWVRPPGASAGSLDDHEVVEYGDKTITVNPSILGQGNDGRVIHGFLIRGEWREG